MQLMPQSALMLRIVVVTFVFVSSIDAQPRLFSPNEAVAGIIWYAFLQRNASEAPRQEARVSALYEALNKALKDLDCDIPERLAFVTDTFTVQMDWPGNAAGIPETLLPSVASGKDTMFVTQPLSGLDNRALLVLSTRAPNRLTLMTIGERVDQVQLIYDSVKRHVLQNTNYQAPLGPIRTLRVVSKNEIELSEWVTPGIGRPGRSSRVTSATISPQGIALLVKPQAK